VNLVWGQECEICEEGTWCYEGVLNKCPSFSRSVEGSGDISSCKCLKGYAPNELGNCTECSVNEYCYEGVAEDCPLNSRAFRGAWLLSQCMCNEGYTGSNTACVECEAGKYKFWRGGGMCVDCSRNTFQPSVGATNESACQLCAGNSTSERGSVDASACKCNSGFLSASGNAPCTACPIGKYSAGLGNTECESCSETDSNAARRLLSIWEEVSTASSTIPGSSSVYFPAAQNEEECFVCPLFRALSASSIEANVPLCECAEGYWENEEGFCEPCEAGTYKDWIGPELCLLCPHNTYSNLEGSWRRSACLDCPLHTLADEGSVLVTHCVCEHGFEGVAGQSCVACPDGLVFEGDYSLEGDAICMPCGVGKYANDTTKCASCPTFMTCEQGSTSAADCVCEAGYTGTPCMPCLHGSFKDTPGPAACVTCAAGKYSESRGARECTACHDGSSHALEGAKSVFSCLCPGGFYMQLDALLSNFTCELCEVGSVGSGRDTECRVCEAGTYAAGAHCLTCPTGSRSPRAAGDISMCWCEEGFAGSGGVCVACPAGSPQPEWVPVSACSPCVPGSFSASESDACEPCAKDTYQANFGSTACVACGAYGVTAAAGAMSVFECECLSGYSPVGENCVPCGFGLYKESTGNTSCLACEEDLTTVTTGATDAGSCQPCVGDTYLDVDRRCVACPVSIKTQNCACRPGYYGSFLDCQPCPPGTYSSTSGANQCLSCPVGTVNSLWAQRDIESCVLCPAGTYQISVLLCVSCPPGSNSEEGSTSVTDCSCAAGSEPVLIDGVLGFCQTCQAGFFDSGLRVCEACAEGKYNPQVGAVGATSCLNCAANTTQTALSLRDSPESCVCIPGYVRESAGCVACQEGKFSLGVGETSCARCDTSSYYSEPGTGKSENLCLACPENSLALQGGVGVLACECSSGFYRNETEMCRECTPGYYCEDENNEILCPTNAVSEARSTAISDCICRSGYHRKNDACVRCSVGEFCTDEQHYICPSNSHTAGIGGAVSLAQCFCEPGYERLDITMAMYLEGFQLCRMCPSDTYCFGGTLRECPENSVSVVRSKTLSDCICVEGYQGSNGMCVACGSSLICSGVDVESSWRILEIATTARELTVLKSVRFPNLGAICQNLREQLGVTEDVQTMSSLNVLVRHALGDRSFSTSFEAVWVDMQTLVSKHMGATTHLVWSVEFDMVVGHTLYSEAVTLSYVASAMRHVYGVFDTSFWKLNSGSGMRRLLNAGFGGTLRISSVNMPMQTISFDADAIGSFLRQYGYIVSSGNIEVWVNASQTTGTLQHVTQGDMVSFQTGVELSFLSYSGLSSYENFWVYIKGEWILQRAPTSLDIQSTNLFAETHTDIKLILFSSSINAYNIAPSLQINGDTTTNSSSNIRRLLAAEETYELIHEDSVVTQADTVDCNIHSSLLEGVCVCDGGYYCPYEYQSALGCENGQCVSCDDNTTYCIDNNEFRCMLHSAISADQMPGSSKSQCICDPGRYEQEGVCEECSAGFYCINEQSYPCNPGNTDLTSIRLASDVSDCRCKPGWFRVALEASCQPCPKDYYCPASTDVETFPNVFRCRDHSFTIEEGASSVTECLCNSGYKLSLEGSMTVCTECNKDELCHGMTSEEIQCPGNSVANQQQDACVCDVGFQRGPAGTCVSCAPGTTRESIDEPMCTACPDGKKEVDKVCVDCETGEVSWQLSDDAGPTICKCPVGTTYNFGNSPRCVSCVEGKIFNLVENRDYDQGECTGCTAGKFLSGGACVGCPSGSSSAAESTSVTDCECACDGCHDENFCEVLLFGKYGACEGSCPDRVSCSACELGKFKSSIGNEGLCENCDFGKYSDETGKSACETCEDRAATTLSEGSRSPGDCLCVAGYGFDSGSCSQCEPGHFKADVSNAPCSECEVGKYVESMRAESCDPCEGFRSTIQTASTSVQDCLCDKGYYQQSYNGECRACSSVTFKDWIGNELCCYCGNTCGDRDFQNTDVDTTIPRDQVRCVDCTYIYQGNAAGDYGRLCQCIPGWQFTDTVAQCERCPQNQIQPGYSYSLDDQTPRCKICTVEHFFIASGVDCGKCSINHVNDGTDFTDGIIYRDDSTQIWGRDHSDCRCLMGYEPDTESANCIRCVPGKYQSQRSHEYCQSCDLGKYGPDYARSSDCISCPSNSNTEAGGSTTISDCICDTGYERVGDECDVCVAGKYYGSSNTCEFCESGSYQDETGKTACKGCGANAESIDPYNDESTCRCISGYSDVTASVPLTCEICVAGKYSSLESGVRVCVDCPDHSTTEFAGAEDISACVCDLGAGFAESVCELCEVGYYKDTIGNDLCMSCGPEKTTQTEGSQSIDDCQCNSGLGFFE